MKKQEKKSKQNKTQLNGVNLEGKICSFSYNHYFDLVLLRISKSALIIMIF